MPAPTKFLTVVLELPSDAAAAQDVLKSLPLFGRFKGARVTVLFAGEATTENELLEQHIRPHEVRLIRERVNQPALMTLKA